MYTQPPSSVYFVYLLSGEALRQRELAGVPLHLVGHLAHAARQVVRVLIPLLHQPSSETVMVNVTNITLASAGLDEAASRAVVAVITDPALQVI